MRKALYVFFEGLAETVIDSQVMLHARETRERHIVDFEIWVFACSRDLYKRSLARLNEVQRLSQSKVRLFLGIRPGIPLSPILNAFLLLREINRSKPNFSLIHARTDYSAAVCGCLKFFKSFEMIWDCRGDSEAEASEIYHSRNPVQKLIRLYLIIINRWRVYWASAMCQKAVFVSDHLKQIKGKGLKNKEFHIIPSTASEEHFFFSESLRKQIREKLDYSAKNRVIIYSGSLSHYQGLPESVNLFRRLHQKDKNFRLLIVTPHIHGALHYLSDLPKGSYRILSARIGEINALLNAADFALLLRKHNPTNKSASPTKFAEYSLAGLPIIMTDSIPGLFALAEENENLCEYRDGNVSLSKGTDRKKVSDRYKGLLSRRAALPKYKRLYNIPGRAKALRE